MSNPSSPRVVKHKGYLNVNALNVLDPKVLSDLKSDRPPAKIKDTYNLLSVNRVKRKFLNNYHPSLENTMIGRSLKSEYDYKSKKFYNFCMKISKN